jgi:hypothetical protein
MKKYFFILFILISGNFIFSNNYVYASSCSPILRGYGDVYIVKYDREKSVEGFRVVMAPPFGTFRGCLVGINIVNVDNAFLEPLLSNSSITLSTGVYQMSAFNLSNMDRLSENPSAFAVYKFKWHIKSIFTLLSNSFSLIAYGIIDTLSLLASTFFSYSEYVAHESIGFVFGNIFTVLRHQVLIFPFILCNVLLVFLFIKFLKKMRSKNVIEKP